MLGVNDVFSPRRADRSAEHHRKNSMPGSIQFPAVSGKLSANGAKSRVILIDPTPATRDAMALRLRSAGYEVETIDDSAAGANRALAAPPSALVVDLWMPGLSGVQVCRLLKAEPATADVPVILRGLQEDRKSRFWAQRAGAASFVVKDDTEEAIEELSRAIAAAPPVDGFFMQLSGGSHDIQSRIAQHLDAALFESVIATDVRTLGGAGSFAKLFEQLSRLVSDVSSYRWLALSSTTPEHFAVHHPTGAGPDAVSEARQTLKLDERVEASLVDGLAPLEGDGLSVPVTQPLIAGGVRIGSIALSVPIENRPDAVTLLSFVARELGAPLGMVAANEKLQSAADFMRDIYHAIPNALFVFDRTGLVRAVNTAALALLGYTEEELIGRPATLLFDAADLPNLELVEAPNPEAATLRSERTCIPKAGARIPVLLSFTPLRGTGHGEMVTGTVCVAVDIRERKKLELDLYQAQKLEAVGRLAAGVAHEINTPIQFVNDSIHFVRDAVKDVASLIDRYRELQRSVLSGSATAEQAADLTAAEENADLNYLLENLPRALDRSLEGLDRVTVIVRSMKEFAHPDRRDMIATDLNQAIRSTLTIARSEYRSVADVETELGDIPLVTCHPGDVNQAILNIVVNAAHAIGDIVRGTEQRGLIHVGTHVEDETVVITIRDSGGGIPDSIATQIFDPFFTTKEVGKGTGQGLAIARSVIHEKHGGELTFQSDRGKGTSFFIRLPVHGKNAAAGGAA
jgi:two-component system NtrC family sensor kinase